MSNVNEDFGSFLTAEFNIDELKNDLGEHTVRHGEDSIYSGKDVLIAGMREITRIRRTHAKGQTLKEKLGKMEAKIRELGGNPNELNLRQGEDE